MLVPSHPSVTGAANGSLTVTDSSGRLGFSADGHSHGLGHQSCGHVAPGGLLFHTQVVNVSTRGQSVVLMNTGTGPTQVASVTATARFLEPITAVQLSLRAPLVPSSCHLDWYRNYCRIDSHCVAGRPPVPAGTAQPEEREL